MKYFLILMMTINTAISGDYVKSHLNTPMVVNRIVSLQAINHGSGSDHGVDPLDLPLRGVRDNSLPPVRWRQFRFADNTGGYIPMNTQKSKTAAATATVTKTYLGVVDWSFRIDQNGSVVLTNIGDSNE
jgi:hypothetical protein